MADRIRIAGGSLYLDARLYERWFADVQTVVLLGDPRSLLLVPVAHAPAGGLLVKVRNARGDRVVHAPEALAGRGLPEDLEGEFPVAWDERAAALRINLTVAPSGVETTDTR